jgi:hypothetical protein
MRGGTSIMLIQQGEVRCDTWLFPVLVEGSLLGCFSYSCLSLSLFLLVALDDRGGSYLLGVLFQSFCGVPIFSLFLSFLYYWILLVLMICTWIFIFICIYYTYLPLKKTLTFKKWHCQPSLLHHKDLRVKGSRQQQWRDHSHWSKQFYNIWREVKIFILWQSSQPFCRNIGVGVAESERFEV